MKNMFRRRGCIFVTLSGETRVRYASKTAGKKLSNNRTALARSLSCQVRVAAPLLSASSLLQAFPCPGHLLSSVNNDVHLDASPSRN